MSMQRIFAMDFRGVEVKSSPLAPEGAIWNMNQGGVAMCFLGPITFWRFKHEGRWPLISRYSAGMNALEAERRKVAR